MGGNSSKLFKENLKNERETFLKKLICHRKKVKLQEYVNRKNEKFIGKIKDNPQEMFPFQACRERSILPLFEFYIHHFD